MPASAHTRDRLLASKSNNDQYMSPSHPSRHSTPPRLLASDLCRDSAMRTPSPNKQHALFSNTPSTNHQHDPDDLFLQSPFSTASAAPVLPASFLSKPQPINADDEEGAIFLASSSSVPPFLPLSASKPQRTPIKQVHRSQSRPILSSKPTHHLNRATSPTISTLATSARVGAGTKRKSTAHLTPLRSHTLTPLKVVSPRREKDACGTSFDRLAPLTAPRFIDRTPQTKVETEVHLRKQTATLTKLKITDRSGGRPRLLDGDSGGERDDDESTPLFSRSNTRLDAKPSARQLLLRKGKGDDEVAEISPGGHVTKRRARSRPLSDELLNTHKTPAATPSPKKQMLSKTSTLRGTAGTVAFPSVSKSRMRTLSASSNSSEGASPRPRRRATGGLVTGRNPLKVPQTTQLSTRKPLSRQESLSSATLFFGPAIPQPPARDSLVQSTDSNCATPIFPSYKISTPQSYTRPPSNDPAWHTIQNHPPSPNSSPVGLAHQTAPLARRSLFDDDEDMFLDDLSGPAYVMNEPSPRPKKEERRALPTKYKPRDSGIVMSDEDDILSRISQEDSRLSMMPGASTSLNSIASDADDGLKTPGVGPDVNSSWPGAEIFVKSTDDRHDFHSDLGPDGYVDVDAFIMRTLAAPTKSTHPGLKRMPGTPVKSRTLGLSSRPWQSAVANKVGLNWDNNKKGKMPRKSLPAAFALPGGKLGKLTLDQVSDSEGDEDSPSGRKERYSSLGLGRPSMHVKDTLPALQRTRWLSRRSSSGAFSSGSESVVTTPTQTKNKDWHLPVPKFNTSPLRTQGKASPTRTASGSSTSTITAQSPTKPHLPIADRFSRTAPKTGSPIKFVTGPTSPNDEEKPGKFEQDFDEVGELGSGEFGKVIKIRSKVDESQISAVKRSKTFEGPRHRRRLREEVEVLKHLQCRVLGQFASGRHPNVLAYIDSWEEDDALFIQTELCESGNLAGFLWEYGRAFPRLDEARVWKIFADLSNGLGFIHDSNVIHLDLKPSNIFLTGEGRFKIGDFGMASVWPRPMTPNQSERGFEREGDKVYLAPEVLQGKYGKAADVFSFGVMMLETATNIVVPDQGEAWHRLRTEDFSQVDLEDSPELFELIRSMMRTDPEQRINVRTVYDHVIVSRARATMDHAYEMAIRSGTSTFAASPLASGPDGFLEEILGHGTDGVAMDVSY